MEKNRRNEDPLLAQLDYLNVLSSFDEGVIITDQDAHVIFYNATQAKIDDLDPSYVLGKKVTEIYDLDENTSMIMRCLNRKEHIVNEIFMYRTRLGRVANTIHSVFPLFKGNELIGTICFVRDYNLLESTIASASTSLPHRNRTSLTNGTRFTFDHVIGSDPEFLRSVKTAKKAAVTNSPILLFGETGTGKELFAQSIHNYSPRADRQYIAINCAAIPENLLEGVLFGTARGAFTGAVDRQGLFERANGGTLFLDEVGSMPVGLQTKLLRVLQEKKVRRVGSLKERGIDLKIISSLSTEPHQAIEEGLLRMDLFYRLAVVIVQIPPLRNRPGDIEELTRHFVSKNNATLGKNVETVAAEVMDLFTRCQWPGNVRELEHIVEATMNMLGDADTIKVGDLPTHFVHRAGGLETSEAVKHRPVGAGKGKPRVTRLQVGRVLPPPIEARLPQNGSLVELQAKRERQMIHEALTETRGNVSRAAQTLGISRQLLHYKMKKLALNRRSFTE